MDVTPVEKVIMMIKDLQTKVTEEGHMEATTYDKFACFCKSKTDEKVEAISEGEMDADALTTKIQDLQAKRAQLDLDIQSLNEEIAGYEEQIAESKGLRKEEVATFDAALTDMEKAISALERAIETLKTATGVSLAQVKSIVRTSLLMADAMDMAPKSRKVVTMLLSEDQPITDVPTSDYDSHSGGIIETLEGLLGTFRDRKTTLESDNETADSDYNLAMQAKLDQLTQAQQSLENKQKEKTETSEDIATSQADLTETTAMLNDDRVYLKDLTEKCETKAKLWDQRSQMRADELSALTQALSVLETTVAEKAELSGEGGRSLQQKENKTETKQVEPVAFLQEKVIRKLAGPDDDAFKRDKLLSLLTSEGKKLQSAVLSTLALKVAKDPFKKIKGMIQELIEKLLQEEADEANHKGWCDEEIGKTLKDRDYRLRDITDIHSSIEKLNARKEKLNLTKTELTEEIATLEEDLENQTAAREEEKEEHLQTIEDAKGGLEAIKEAIDILSHFYGAAAKALFQQSPDDEAPDAGFDDTYQGSQGASTGILGMMEVIQGDFERTIKETTEAEEQAKRDFIEYDRETRMSIAAKKNALEATTTELTEVMDNLSTQGDELRTQQELLDTAVKTWEELLPGCVADPGMSYEERVARRNQELQALKDAYCILDDQEAGCSGVFLQKSATTKRLRGERRALYRGA